MCNVHCAFTSVWHCMCVCLHSLQATRLHVELFLPNDIIVQQDDLHDQMYIVVEGHVVSQWTGFGSERSLLLDLREPYRKFE